MDIKNWKAYNEMIHTPQKSADFLKHLEEISPYRFIDTSYQHDEVDSIMIDKTTISIYLGEDHISIAHVDKEAGHAEDDIIFHKVEEVADYLNKLDISKYLDY